MSYKEFVHQQKNFKYSINIQHDLNQADKLSTYILSHANVQILEGLFNEYLSTDKKKSQASKILYGPYGSGKSHLVTVIGTILEKGLSRDNYNDIISNIEMYNQELADKIRKFLFEGRPFIVVPVQSYNLSFEKTIYASLIKKLELKGINVQIKDCFYEAITILDKWLQNDEYNAAERVRQISKRHRFKLKELKKQLHLFDVEALHVFKQIFYDFTSGIEFQPSPSGLTDNLNDINEKVIEHGYSGIVFVFDEFGSYLENNIKSLNVKSIQDLAEYCDHGNYNNHLLLISHKEIMQYISFMDTYLVEEWKKVEGRFRPISLSLDEAQFYHLIQHAIPKYGYSWNKFRFDHEKQFIFLNTGTKMYDIFPVNSQEEFNESIIYGGFPLHPLVAYMLDRLAKKVAQNERTVFTFLAGDEQYSLGHFLSCQKETEFHFIGLDWIYNYFELNFYNRKGSYENQQWMQVQAAVNKLNNNDPNYNVEIKILKSLSVINMINDFESVKPDKNVLIQVIDEPQHLLDICIKELEQQKIIIYSRQYSYYRFFDASSKDSEEIIEKTIAEQNDKYYLEVLNKEFIQLPVLPYEYNATNRMTRYYYPVCAEIDNLEDTIKKIPIDRDGLLIFLITLDKNVTNSKKLNGERIIYLLRSETKRLKQAVQRYIALKHLLTNENDLASKDPLLVPELQAYLQENYAYINEYIMEWNNPGKEDVSVVSQGKHLKLSSRQKLSEYMSEQMEKNFGKTLIVNNELVNKNNLSGVMKSYRREIINKILFEEIIIEDLGYKPKSAQYVFWHSVMGLNGYPGFTRDEDVPDISKLEPDRVRRGKKIAQLIEEKIKCSADSALKFIDLYKSLKAKPYGLRDGYIPLLIAAVIRKYNDVISITLEQKEQQLDGELLEKMIETPERYEILIDHWPHEKEEYIRTLESLFSDYINEENRNRNRLNAVYDGMLSYYRHLSKLARTSNQFVDDNTIGFRKLFDKQVYNYRQFFFEDIKVLADTYEQISTNIINAIEELDSVDNRVYQETKSVLEHVFSLDTTMPIAKSLIDIFDEEWKIKAKYSFHFLSNRFLDFVSTLDQNCLDDFVIKQIASLLTGFDIAYWGDRQLEDFNSNLCEIRKQLDEFIPEKNNNVTISDTKGSDKVFIVDDMSLNDNQEILKRILIKDIEDFAQALNYKQKQRVILDVLRKYQ